MAKAKAMCTCAKCGTTFEVTKICNNRREADSFEAWAADHCTECPECYKARKQQEREAANTLAAEKSRGAGFPDLIGSEKQIAWALKIRQDFIDEYLPWEKLTDEGREFMIRFMTEYNSAGFWIDHRNGLAGLYIKVGKLFQSLKTENTAEAVPSVENIYK